MLKFCYECCTLSNPIDLETIRKIRSFKKMSPVEYLSKRDESIGTRAIWSEELFEQMVDNVYETMESLGVGYDEIRRRIGSYGVSFIRNKKPSALGLSSNQLLYRLSLGKLDEGPRYPIFEACFARCVTEHFLSDRANTSVLWVPPVHLYKISDTETTFYRNNVELLSDWGVSLRIVEVGYGFGEEKALEMTGFWGEGLCSYLSFPGTKDLTHYSSDY